MENNCKIECNEQQLRLIQASLDIYSRIAIGQFDVLQNVKHSPDWEQYHSIRDKVDTQLNIARNMLIGEEMGRNGSWGIYNDKVDKTAVEAFDILQHIRHCFWLRQEDKASYTVDASKHIKHCTNVKVEIT